MDTIGHEKLSMFHPQVGRDAFHCPIISLAQSEGFAEERRGSRMGWVCALDDSGWRVTQGIRGTEWNPSLSRFMVSEQFKEERVALPEPQSLRVQPSVA